MEDDIITLSKLMSIARHGTEDNCEAYVDLASAVFHAGFRDTNRMYGNIIKCLEILDSPIDNLT